MIRIFRYVGSIDLSESDNGKTLSELKFKPNESLSAYKKNAYLSVKVPLLSDDRKEFNKAVKDIFTAWFYYYAEEDS